MAGRPFEYNLQGEEIGCITDSMFIQQSTFTDMVCTTQEGKEEEQDGSTTEEMSDTVDLIRVLTPPPVIGKTARVPSKMRGVTYKMEKKDSQQLRCTMTF